MPYNSNGRMNYDYKDVRHVLGANPRDAPYGYFAWEQIRGVTVHEIYSDVFEVMKHGMVDKVTLVKGLARLAEARTAPLAPVLKATIDQYMKERATPKQVIGPPIARI